MGMNKKGVFFIALAIILLSLFVISITFYSAHASRSAVQKRVESLSVFVNSVEADLSRQLFIFGFRSIFVMEREIVERGYYLDDNVSVYVSEAFYNGSFAGETDFLLQTAGYEALQDTIQDRASKISVDASLTNTNISLTQEDPWNIKLVLTTDIFISDKNGLASWNKTLVSVTHINIQNFTDPVYSLNTNGERNPKIINTPHTTFEDVSVVNSHLANGYYRNFTGAPSFLDRLEGNIESPKYPEYGIESLVKIDDIPVAYRKGDRSAVDYIYFSSIPHSSCQISGTIPSIRLDTPQHTSAYGVSC